MNEIKELLAKRQKKHLFLELIAVGTAPTTSQPSIGYLIDAFEEAKEETFAGAEHYLVQKVIRLKEMGLGPHRACPVYRFA